jgi:YD repeat-containing protein
MQKLNTFFNFIFILTFISAGCSDKAIEKNFEAINPNNGLRGKVKSLEQFNFNPDGVLRNKDKISFNKNGFEERREGVVMEDNSKTESVYLYDEKWNIIEWRVYNNGLLWVLENYEYDEKKGRTKVTKSNQEGVPIEIITFENTYDNKGNLIEQASSDGQKTTNKYDDKGNIYERRQYKNGVLTGGSSSKYDNEGNEIETVSFDENSKPTVKLIMKYDKNGNMIEMNYTNIDVSSANELTKYKYEFDKIGNWVEQLTTSDVVGISKAKREFEYYH